MKIDDDVLEKKGVELEKFEEVLEDFESDSHLSRPQAIVFILTNKYGLSNEEVALTLPVEVGTVRSHRQRAKEKVEKARKTVGVTERWID